MKNGKRKIGTNESGKAKKLIITALIQPILFLAFTLIFTFISYSGKDPTSNTELFSFISLLASGGIGAFIITKLGGEGGALSALFATALSSSLFLIISLITNGKITAGSLMNILCFILISVFFIFIGKQRKKENRIRKHI